MCSYIHDAETQCRWVLYGIFRIIKICLLPINCRWADFSNSPNISDISIHIARSHIAIFMRFLMLYGNALFMYLPYHRLQQYQCAPPQHLLYIIRNCVYPIRNAYCTLFMYIIYRFCYCRFCTRIYIYIWIDKETAYRTFEFRPFGVVDAVQVGNWGMFVSWY